MTVVVCSKGYPGKYKKNKKIKNIQKIKLSKNDNIFHAGTKFMNGNVYSIGGRVFNVTSVGDKFINIRRRIISIRNEEHKQRKSELGGK